MRSAIKYPGGKYYLAEFICAKIADLQHRHYVETHFGSGAVFFKRGNGQGFSEVINDIDHNVTNFWQVLQDREMREELVNRLLVTPFSEEEFRISREFLDGAENVSMGVDRAFHFFVCNRQSRQASGTSFATMSKSRTRAGMNEQVSSWLSAIHMLPEFTERLMKVAIFSRDANSLIKGQDSKHTLFYVDPPYWRSTRNCNLYSHEMTNDQHILLLEQLSTIEGTFLLSGYRNAYYDGFARAHGWHRVDVEIDNKSSSKTGEDGKKEIKTESLWCNRNLQGTQKWTTTKT